MDEILRIVFAGAIGLNAKIVYDWLRGKKNGTYDFKFNSLANDFSKIEKRFNKHIEDDAKFKEEIFQRLTRIETLLTNNRK